MNESSFALLLEGSRHDQGLFDLGHWRWTHTRPAFDRGRFRTSTSGHNGFPDYTAVRERQDGTTELIFIEIKATKGKIALDQEIWIRLLRAAGQTVYVWWPEDIEEVERVLL